MDSKGSQLDLYHEKMEQTGKWQSERRTVTAEQARAMLEYNRANRRLRESVVRQYADQMTRGEWVDSVCPPIIIGKRNVLLDGQHRLHAQVRSGTTHTWEVRRIAGVSDPLLLPLDRGVRRGPSDVLGYPKLVVEVVACATRMTSKETPTIKTMHDYAVVFSEPAGRLLDFAPTRTRGVSAGARLGAVLALMSYAGVPTKEQWVMEQYRSVTLSALHSMSPVIVSLWGYLKERKRLAGQAGQQEDAVRSREAFRYEKMARARVIVRKEAFGQLRQEILGWVDGTAVTEGGTGGPE